MTSMLRKLQRRVEQRAVSGQLSVQQQSDLATLQPKDIESVSFDAEEETITAEFLLPVDGGQDYATHTLILDCDPLEADPGSAQVLAALRELLRALATTARNTKASNASKLPPCATCISACCRDTVIRLLQEDLDRLREAGINTDAVVPYSLPSALEYVGAIDATAGACPYLSNDTGCTIYEHRPTICREYSAWTCSAYEEDPEKTAGRRRLSVVTEKSS